VRGLRVYNFTKTVDAFLDTLGIHFSHTIFLHNEVELFDVCIKFFKFSDTNLFREQILPVGFLFLSFCIAEHFFTIL